MMQDPTRRELPSNDTPSEVGTAPDAPTPVADPTPADVELVARAIWSSDWPDGVDWSEARATELEYRQNAHAVLAALAAAGRLLPADAGQTEWTDPTGAFKRITRIWPDGSRWDGPWLPVPTIADKITEEPTDAT